MSLLDDVCWHATALDGAWRDHAWDIEGAVFKTATGRIFAICAGSQHIAVITLKLPPDDAPAALTLAFVKEATWPSRWLSATITTVVERDIVLEWVDQSYRLASHTRRS